MEFLRAIGPVFNFLLLAGALFFLTRKRIRKLFRDRKERIAEALGRAADAQDQARHTAEDIAEAQQAADAQAQCQLADAQRQAEANTAAADAETARQAEAVRRSAQQTEAQLRSDMEDRVSDAAIGRITAAAAGVLAQDAFAPARANLVDDFLAHIGEHLTTQPSDALALAETGTLTVTVESAEPLSAAALDALTDTLTRAYGHVTVMTTVRPELIGGVCLRIGDTHYDGTLRHALDLLEQDAANSVLHTTQKTPDLADCIRAKLADTHVGIDVFQSGVVTSLSDGICRIRGLADAMAGELLAFDGTLRGMVMDLGREDIGVVLLGPYGHLQEGDRVRRTGQIMSVPVGEEMTGRVVDALGRPIDGLGPIRTTERRAIESPAPGVIARKGVSVPLQTGIKAIDALVPIGRGQRELIIGDRQTGKPSTPSSTRRTPACCASTSPSARRNRPSRASCRNCATAAPWPTPPSCARTHPRPRPCSTSRPTRAPPSASTSCTADATCSSSMTTCRSRPWPTVRFPCCCSVRPDARPTPATCFTCTPACSSAPRA